jgi:hypothetical protein
LELNVCAIKIRLLGFWFSFFVVLFPDLTPWKVHQSACCSTEKYIHPSAIFFFIAELEWIEIGFWLIMYPNSNYFS